MPLDARDWTQGGNSFDIETTRTSDDILGSAVVLCPRVREIAQRAWQLMKIETIRIIGG